MGTPSRRRLPSWLAQKIPAGGGIGKVKALLGDLDLNTVCQSARCPNLGQCFSQGCATFLILGSSCTRNCGFCAVPGAPPLPPDPVEPTRVAEAARRLGLAYVVVTSVTRDDLPDGGAAHFRDTVAALRARPGVRVEVLVPDFRGSLDSVRIVVEARPTVFNHNVETVPGLYYRVRPQADYPTSLDVLRGAKFLAPSLLTKSGLMVGLGEEPDEVRAVMENLREVGCDLLTIGQYLQPSLSHLPVVRYVHPDEFAAWREEALALGFRGVASGPLVRSSHQAHRLLAEAEGHRP